MNELKDKIKVYKELPDNLKNTIFNTWSEFNKYENIKNTFDVIKYQEIDLIYDKIIHNIQNKIYRNDILSNFDNNLYVLIEYILDKLDYDYNEKTDMIFQLCTRPTQFTTGKTELTLREIITRYRVNSSKEYHLIDIIITNKSLTETEQWKIRTNKKFNRIDNIIIDILSSKADKYRCIDKYISDIMNAKNKNEMPNILIMCYHNTRVTRDLIKLLECFSGKNYIKLESEIYFNISLDEPDTNLTVTKDFIKETQNQINKKIVKGITFITATPVDKFWNILEENGIHKLLNINYENIQNFDTELENYRSFKDNNIIIHDNYTVNPLEYIKDVYENNLIDESKRIIIYAPAHLYTIKENIGSHKEVCDYFLSKKYCILLMNGKFKGFIFPDENKISLDSFKEKYEIKDELRSVLVKWNQLYPKLNLAITGYWNIERGITFNTIGFNFTHAILSNYHAENENKLIQLAGRCTGGKKYVQKINVITTKKIRDCIINFNDNLKKICELNPKEFYKVDFKKNYIIPIKLTFIDDNLLQTILVYCKDRKKKRGYEKKLHNMIVDGIKNNKIKLEDKNNINKFEIEKYQIHSVGLYKIEHKKETRNFMRYIDSFNNNNPIKPSTDCKKFYYDLDLAWDSYIFKDYNNKPNIGWISFNINKSDEEYYNLS